MIGNLRRLEAYYWVARLGGVGAAAAHLGLTQPSVSVRVKELERELGTQLFHRVGRNVRLSESGVVIAAGWSPLRFADRSEIGPSSKAAVAKTDRRAPRPHPQPT